MKQPLLAVTAASVAAVLILALPFAAFAGDDDDAKREEWVQRYQELLTRTATLKSDYESALADYSRARSTRDLTGEGKAGLIKEMNRLKEELAAAEKELAEFPDVARRAGALPGWFRDVEPPAAAAATEQPAAAARGFSSGHSRRLSDRSADEETPAAADEGGAADGGSRSASGSSHGLPSRRDDERERRRLSH